MGETAPLCARIAAIARNDPARAALADGTRSATYGELWSQASRFAAWLRGNGVVAGDRVALVLANGIEAAAACYGAWLAGAVAVPLNAQARARDLVPWLQHCGARAIVHAAGSADVDEALRAPGTPALRVAVGAGARSDTTVSWDALPACADAPATAHHAGDALATILYTSGTTGAPKGVMLSERNVASNVDSIVEYLALGAHDSIVSVLPFYYSYGASVLHTHLSVGARVVLESNTVFPQLIAEALARERATGFSGVPSTYALLLDRVPLAQYDLTALRYVTQAGGAMAPALASRLRAALPGARVFVMYGQTEATARLTWLPPERLDEKAGSVGIPVPGVELDVRSESGAPLARGEVGEVWVRGANVMAGYWNNAEATAQVLRDGWLRTGDLGRLDEEGYLFLSGRRSDMIKTGAHRVHPQDIEEVLAEIDGVVESAVVGIDDELLGQVIKAFIVGREGKVPTPEQVKAHCRARLPIYKIPKHVEFVAALPRTASGKVRRVQLAGTPQIQVSK